MTTQRSIGHRRRRPRAGRPQPRPATPELPRATRERAGRPAATSTVNFEAEGFLDGVQGRARAARKRLLRELFEDGFTLEELSDAVAKDRIAWLPSERLLGNGDRNVPRYTAEEIAELAGVNVEDLRYTYVALGMPLADPGVRAHTEADVELGRLLAVALAAGLSVEAVAEVDRIIARGIARIVAASRTAVIEATLRPGMTEHDAAQVWAAAASQLVPTATRLIVLAFEAHLRTAVQQEQVGAAEIQAARLPGARAVAIAFVDIVGFTQLGQRLPAEDLGRVARQLQDLAAGLVRPPTALVKTLGDAVMLASADPEHLLQAVVILIEEAGELDGFPPIRAGVTHGDAHERSGDWYGDSVNLASRLTKAADPGTVVVTQAVRDRAPSGFRWTPFAAGELKGVLHPPRLYTAVSERPPGGATWGRSNDRARIRARSGDAATTEAEGR